MPDRPATSAAKPNFILGLCLAGLVAFPLLAASILFGGLRSERVRFGDFAGAADVLEIVQDAEVDFSLARRAGQSYMRTGVESDRASVGELVETARRKLRSLDAGRVDAATFADITRLHTQLGLYANLIGDLLGQAGRRREIAERGLRSLGEAADADFTLYASRWNRVGLIALAGELARARVAVNMPSTAATIGPDDLARAMTSALDLADTAEIPVPEAAAVVRRIRTNLNAFVEMWRQMVAIDERLAAATTAGVFGPAREISEQFEALGEQIRSRQRANQDESRRAAIWNDTIAVATFALVLLLSAGAAFAAWRVFATQRALARAESARRVALEGALAKLDAAIRATRAGGRGEVVFRIPPLENLPPPVIETETELEPEAPTGPAAVPAADNSPAGKIRALRAANRAKKAAAAEEAGKAAETASAASPFPKTPRRTKLSRTGPTAPEPAAPPAAAEPATDALLAMLMQSLAEPNSQNPGKDKPSG
ncbi:MAG: hypothetical protein GC202_04275 [Alphaproteobacteria bacterium]|nr:hypothetical protein [Alphaproteobacteria bacterium]